MSGLVDSAIAVMRGASARVDDSAINVANMSTPGFKRRLASPAAADGGFADRLDRLRVDAAAGKLIETGRPLDLAITGPGYFQLRAGERMVYSRQGNFARDADGHLVTPQGYVLQQAGGGDLTIDAGTVSVTADGVMLDGDRPMARVAVMSPGDPGDARAIDGSLFAIDADRAVEVTAPSLRQGALEASNVSLGDEMISMMAGVRGAETGARLIQAYDDLLGKAIGTFGQAGR